MIAYKVLSFEKFATRVNGSGAGSPTTAARSEFVIFMAVAKEMPANEITKDSAKQSKDETTLRKFSITLTPPFFIFLNLINL